jgi:hypothetical protein
MTSIYYCKYSVLKFRYWYKEIQDILCIAMFRSVLTPYVYEYDEEIVWKDFTRYLVVQTLNSVPGLRILCLGPDPYANHSAQLAWMITLDICRYLLTALTALTK